MEQAATEPGAAGQTATSPRHAGLSWIAGSLLVLLALAVLWQRGLPAFVAWELARDHERCFGRSRLQARLWSSEPWQVREWLESKGTPVQPFPQRAGDVELVGVRYCPLLDRVAAHVYYGGQQSYVSVYVFSGPARVGDGWQGTFGELRVRLLRSAGRTLAVVGSVESDVDAVTRAFRSSLASRRLLTLARPS